MWVWPQTTVRMSGLRPVSTSSHRARRKSTSTISSSPRGVAWQKNTAPRPSIVIVIDGARLDSSLRWLACSSPAAQEVINSGSAARSPFRCSRSSRSVLPRIQEMRSPRRRSRSRTSHGLGPAATSPSTTTRSAAETSCSARTASSAGSTPWMSDRTATRFGIGTHSRVIAMLIPTLMTRAAERSASTGIGAALPKHQRRAGQEPNQLLRPSCVTSCRSFLVVDI